jgi:pimeloyl-ACP methyl ester carboxylesterase
MARMPKGTIRRESAPTEPRVRRGYFECRYGQLHVHNVMPAGGGFEEGTALLCVHDPPATARQFVRFLPLAGRDRSVYAPDLPGSGESDPAPPPVQPTDYATALGDFLDSLRLRQVDVLGYRGGTLPATELAAARPNQVRRLMLVSVPLGAAAAPHYPLRERLHGVTQRLLLLRARDELWEATARARELVAAARLVELREGGAEPFAAAPAEVATAVLEFLRA